MAKGDLFDKQAPRLIFDLMKDFDFDLLSAAAVAGNAGHESGGFELLQEIKPTVAGSKGGYGWFQWTGPRRRAFEAWAKENSFALNTYEANYGFLRHELRGTESQAVPAVKKAVGLPDKVRAFELKYERAGVKHYDSREAWALRAIDAYRKSVWSRVDQPPKPPPVPAPKPLDMAVNEPTVPGPKSWWQSILALLGGSR